VQNSVWAENIFELANQNLRHKHRRLGRATFTIESVAVPAQRYSDESAKLVLV
jgi:hypothetical protein